MSLRIRNNLRWHCHGCLYPTIKRNDSDYISSRTISNCESWCIIRTNEGRQLLEHYHPQWDSMCMLSKLKRVQQNFQVDYSICFLRRFLSPQVPVSIYQFDSLGTTSRITALDKVKVMGLNNILAVALEI